jgi:2-aminobenzoylacetyl-CoA thioesterase
MHVKSNPYPVKWTKHIWLLGIPEFPSFLIAGENACALIEAGVSALVPQILKGFDSIGLFAPLKFLFAAHAHADHVAGLIMLKTLYPELILAGSKETARILEKEKIIQNFGREDLMYAKYMADEGFVEDVGPALSTGPVSMDREYEEGEVIDLGNVRIQLVDAPGHAPGNTAFWIQPDNVILISDSAGYAGSEDDILPLFFHHYKNAISSLEKIKSLEADHIGLGHNVIINGKDASAAFLDRAIGKTTQMRTEIARLGCNESKTLCFIETMSEKMLDYGLFKSFSKEVRENFARLLIRRALESLPA